MRLRAAFAAFAAALVAMSVLASTSTAAPPLAASNLTTPITGTLGNGGTFTGNFTLDRFTTQNGALAAVGTLTGTLTDALGNVIGTVDQTITTALTPTGTCQILNLTLGPLDLNLLGLMVHLNQVVLNITAQPGPGNLLGNLLCGLAGLLNGNAPLSTIANVLNNRFGL